MLYLDYLAYNNAFKNISIGEKLLFAGGGLILALALPRPPLLLAIAVVMHIALLAARIPPAYLLRLWLAPALFLAVALAGVAISASAAPFTALAALKAGPFYLGVTAAGIETAGNILLRSLAAVSCLFFLATTTPAAHLAGYMARFSLLRPVGEIALLTYRFIFVFLAAAAQIYTAQQSRLGYADSRRSLRSLGLLAASIGRKAFLTARDLNIALTARGYQSRLSYHHQGRPANPARLAAIALILAAIAATAFI